MRTAFVFLALAAVARAETVDYVKIMRDPSAFVGRVTDFSARVVLVEHNTEVSVYDGRYLYTDMWGKQYEVPRLYKVSVPEASVKKGQRVHVSGTIESVDKSGPYPRVLLTGTVR